MGKTTCGHPSRKPFSHGDCKPCAEKKYAQRRQERLQEKRKQDPAARIKQQTEITGILKKIYTTLRKELLPLNPVCQGKGKIEGCTGKANQIHHGKGRRGFLLILSKYFRYLCHNCHDFCTENSTEAKELGLSVQINSKTDWAFTDREKELIEKHKLKLPKGTQ